MSLVKWNRRKAQNRDSLVKDRRGLSTVEYVIVLALIAVAAIGAWRSFGGRLVEKVNNSGSQVQGL
jgi:Flp pilus assembly pilin Flp